MSCARGPTVDGRRVSMIGAGPRARLSARRCPTTPIVVHTRHATRCCVARRGKVHLVGVGPQRVAEQPRVGHLDRPLHALELVGRRQVGREAAVDAKDLLLDDLRHVIRHAARDRQLLLQGCPAA
eukprot:5326280-Prymnesium_polylepis.2